MEKKNNVGLLSPCQTVTNPPGLPDNLSLIIPPHLSRSYLTFNITRLDTGVEALEKPGLGWRDFPVAPPGRAPHVEEVGDDSLDWIPVKGFKQLTCQRLDKG